MAKKKIEKHCISCGEKGHHYNECEKVPFFGIVASAFNIPTEPVCGMSKEEIIDRINKNAVWNKKEINKKAAKELKKDLEDLQSLIKTKKRIFSFDYIGKVSKNEDGYLVGEINTEEIEAYDAEHATLLFKNMHPNKPFDPPY